MHIPQTEVILRHDGAELAHVTLPPGVYVIGRNADVEICAETPLISRRHAQLTIHLDHVLIEDLGSSNGTFVNGQLIAGATRLFPNQSVRLGPDIAVEIRRPRTATEPGESRAPAQATLRRLLPADLLGDRRYAIGGVVAQGGMGAIVDARQSAIERTVAMKVMLDSTDEEDVLRFLNEAKITGQLEHPNIVPVHELGVDELDQLFYTMKMVRGITLHKVLDLMAEGVEATARKYPLPALLTIFQKVCDALAFAHSKGVIHRDLKPENVMLDDFGVVLVMDWGLAKFVGDTDAPGGELSRAVRNGRAGEPTFRSTLAGCIMGTPQYMSPEQARGEVKTLDARTDIYALGAILYTMLALHPPVSGADVEEVIGKVARGETEPLLGVGSLSRRNLPAVRTLHLPGGRVPESLAAVVSKAMAFDRDQRYPSVEELQRDLAAYQGGFATSAEKAGAAKQFALLIKRNKALCGTAFAAWLIILTLAVWFVVQITASEHQARDTLGQLRATAPTFFEQAKILTAQEKLPEALEKIGVALTLNPTEASLHAQRGNILQTMENFSEAAEAYAAAARLNAREPHAAANLELCRELAAAKEKDGTLTVNTRMRWRDALAAQGRNAEAILAGRGTSFNAKKMLPVWQAQIDDWLGKNSRPLTISNSGLYSLDLTNLSLTDLSPLRGMPVHYLKIGGNPHIKDLSPLAECPLAELYANHLPELVDLAPLKGKKLTRLFLSSTGVVDLAPLAGMQTLFELDIGHTAISDLAPLREARLKILDAQSTGVRSLEPLRGQPLEDLDLSITSVASLAPIGEARIVSLRVNRGGHLDLADLRTRTLRVLFANGTILDHLEILGEMSELETINLPRNMNDPSVLRKLPGLRKIDTTPTIQLEKMKDAADFWRAYEAKQAAGKK